MYVPTAVSLIHVSELSCPDLMSYIYLVWPVKVLLYLACKRSANKANFWKVVIITMYSDYLHCTLTVKCKNAVS